MDHIRSSDMRTSITLPLQEACLAELISNRPLTAGLSPLSACVLCGQFGYYGDQHKHRSASVISMNLVEPGNGGAFNGIEVPQELYWVISSPTPLAGMKFPPSDFPWSSLAAAGFSQVVALHPGSYDPAPLEMCFAEQLQDLISGGPPANEDTEAERVRAAVNAAVKAWRSGQGVVVHCVGGRGRSGTVLGCILRDLGFPAADVLSFLDRVHKSRGKPGWPESMWQSSLVEGWTADT